MQLEWQQHPFYPCNTNDMTSQRQINRCCANTACSSELNTADKKKIAREPWGRRISLLKHHRVDGESRLNSQVIDLCSEIDKKCSSKAETPDLWISKQIQVEFLTQFDFIFVVCQNKKKLLLRLPSGTTEHVYRWMSQPSMVRSSIEKNSPMHSGGAIVCLACQYSKTSKHGHMWPRLWPTLDVTWASEEACDNLHPIELVAVVW